jgi:hypothetical protein
MAKMGRSVRRGRTKKNDDILDWRILFVAFFAVVVGRFVFPSNSPKTVRPFTAMDHVADFKQAKVPFDKLVEFSKHFREGLEYYKSTEFNLNNANSNLEQAIISMKKAHELYPESPEATNSIGVLQKLQLQPVYEGIEREWPSASDFDESLDWQRKSIKLLPKNAKFRPIYFFYLMQTLHLKAQTQRLFPLENGETYPISTHILLRQASDAIYEAKGTSMWRGIFHMLIESQDEWELHVPAELQHTDGVYTPGNEGGLFQKQKKRKNIAQWALGPAGDSGDDENEDEEEKEEEKEEKRWSTARVGTKSWKKSIKAKTAAPRFAAYHQMRKERLPEATIRKKMVTEGVLSEADMALFFGREVGSKEKANEETAKGLKPKPPRALPDDLDALVTSTFGSDNSSGERSQLVTSTSDVGSKVSV